MNNIEYYSDSEEPKVKIRSQCFTVVVGAGTLSPVVAVRVEDGSPSLNILQTFGFFSELCFLVDDVS